MATTGSTRALWVLAPGEAAIREETLPAVGDGEVRVRTRYSAISRGSEALVFGGRVPPSQYAAMRAPFQAGDFPGPVKYGYMSVGDVVEGPPALFGRSIFCLYPHQGEYVVPAEAVVPLPEGLPPERAVLGANMETAVNAVWDGEPAVGERIAVIGAGVVGSLAAWLCVRIPGTAVTLIDRNPDRRGTAAALGVAFATPEHAGGDYDRVFHASGSGDGLALALGLAAFEATIVEMSWYGTNGVTLPLGEAFHARRLTLRSTQVGGLPPRQRPRWDHRRRLALALELLADPAPDALITGESAFEALPEVLAGLAAGPGATLCHRIRYPA